MRVRPLVLSSLLFCIPMFCAMYFQFFILAGGFATLVVTSLMNHGKICLPASKIIDCVVAQTLCVSLSLLAFLWIAPKHPIVGIAAGTCGVLTGIVFFFKQNTLDHIYMHIVGALGCTLFVLGFLKMQQ